LFNGILKRNRHFHSPATSSGCTAFVKTPKAKQTNIARKIRLLAIGALVPFATCGCAVGPDFVRPEPPKVDRYTAGRDPSGTVAAAGLAQSFKAEAQIPAEWWRLFGSAELDRTMSEALASNLTVQAAQANLRVSQDNLRAGEGVFYPQLDLGGAATRQKFSRQKFGQDLPGVIFNLFTLSATISYTLDIFGGERRSVENLGAQVDLQRANVLATYLTLSGNIVNTAVARAAYTAEIEALRNTIDLEKEQIRFTEMQVRSGTVPYSNLLSLQTQLSASEAALPPLEQSLAQAEHLLALLSGRSPAMGVPAPVGLSDLRLPLDLPLTVPSELVRQRPDILASEAQLHSASAEIGVATAALYPNFTLSGSYGVSSTKTNQLFTSAGSFWSFGADVTAPLFHGGTLWAQRQAAIDAYDQAAAKYRQTVLSAFTQVADTLRALEHDAETVEAQSRAVRTAEEALRLIEANYRAGLANYLQVLIANAQYLQAKIGYIQATAQRFQDTVALYVALGGGWWNGGNTATGPQSSREESAMAKSTDR
jgi:NodT family efflux transporter outer membrane factor (OMF) lipoprotein